MKNNYKINLFDLKSINSFIDELEKYKDALGSKKFMEFIADKCILELSRISSEKLDGIKDDDIFAEDVNRYRNSHKIDVGNDIIIISNATMADLSHVSEKTLQNYPNGFSIAKAIEFGTGIWGENNEEFEWSTQANPNRNYSNGWYYEKDGQIHWSKGLGGKYIYAELLNSVQNHFQEWFNEYISKV